MPAFPPQGVFISYRRGDAGPYARLLKEHLRGRLPDTPVFMDLDSIEAGVDFAEVIESAVGSCAVLVALIGPKWLATTDEEGNRRLDDPDNYVRLELRTALERGLRVLPVLVDGARAPEQRQLPGDLRRLAGLNQLETSYGRFEYAEARLEGIIQRLVQKVPAGGDANPEAYPGAYVPSSSTTHSLDLGIPSSRLRVYLGYAQEDTEAADEIAGDLEERGIAVRLDRADITWGESWAAHARSAVETADTFVLVVSSDSSRHVGDWEEVATALDRRGIDVVAVAVPPPVIRDLAGRPVLDYAGPSAGGHLADRIELGAVINFDKLSGRQFETLAAELLPRYGYTPAWSAGLAAQSDSGYNLRFADDSGGQEILVEVKAYRDGGRISVNEIYRLAALVRERDARGILVTTGQLTSVARKAIDGLNDAGARLQVIDGFSLRQMLLANPEIARLHMTGPGPGTVPR